MKDLVSLRNINSEILRCENLLTEGYLCSRNISAIPLVMEPLQTQQILLITRDPSNIANINKTLLGWENTFFRHHILSIFFVDYENKKANQDKQYFKQFSEKFKTIIYWTHFSKCYPGKTKSAHKQPNDFCAKKYLKEEIKAFYPEYMILIGANAIEFITGEKSKDAILKNRSNLIQIAGLKCRVICLIHPSNANNKCKNDPNYGFFESIKIIQQLTNVFKGGRHK